MREGCNLLVSECGNPMSGRSRPPIFVQVLQLLPRMLVARLVFLFSMLLANTMGVSGDIV